ncbi:hypothetical protein [Thalassotalea piscium]|uniref:Uncharacterized protein n=1 Tax=Thalassotalea piscium TaxID=1230533 RepID=A0A7X0NJR6_9GAMM|nr:hypothetical protein [Thalassotalea piscium]MBB6544762.1 hypothetical protein [Thalassotalea piscium]
MSENQNHLNNFASGIYHEFISLPLSLQIASAIFFIVGYWGLNKLYKWQLNGGSFFYKGSIAHRIDQMKATGELSNYSSEQITSAMVDVVKKGGNRKSVILFEESLKKNN